MQNHSYVIVTAYTKDTGYEEEFRSVLEPSLLKFNIPYYAKPYTSMGSWNKNCKVKPIVLLEAMTMVPNKSLVWLDVDCVIRSEPVLFDSISTSDRLIHIVHSPHEFEQGLTCLLGLRCGPLAKVFLLHWLYEMLHVKWDHCSDMEPLRHLMHKVDMWTKELNGLPLEYCKVLDLMPQVTNPIIETFQASRRFKEAIDG